MGRSNQGGYPLTPSFLLAVKQGLRRRGLHHSDLPISDRQWIRWNSKEYKSAFHDGKPKLIRESTVKAIAESLEVGVDELVAPQWDYVGLEGVAHATDVYVMKLVRSLRDSPDDLLRSAYEDHLHAKLAAQGENAWALLMLLNDHLKVAEIARTIPDPDMIIDVSANRERIEFRLPGERALRVDHPLLMWDCHCETPQTNRLPSDCPIHRHPLGDQVTSVFREGLVLIQIDGLKFLWRNIASLWPPSIDSFLMLSDLRRRLAGHGDLESIVDLGCGTGFLGIELAANDIQTRLAVFADWLIAPLFYSAINWALNATRLGHARPYFTLGIHSYWAQRPPERFPCSIAVCNPPYLPSVRGFERLGLDLVVAGTDLLQHVIAVAPELGEMCFVHLSQLAWPEAEAARKKSGHGLKRLSRSWQSVPFRVRNALLETGYVDALVEERGLLLRSHRHPWWHKIATFEVTSSRNAT